MNEASQSNEILRHNMDWLLSSDIRIKNGPNKGALFGWKNLDPVSLPFIYSEITGYAITAFSWIYSEFSNTHALQAARDSSEWIIKNMRSYMLLTRTFTVDNSDKIGTLYYAFDNGMILIGLLNLYKLTNDQNLLKIAEHMGRTLIDRFFDGTKLIPRLDESYQPIIEDTHNGIVKWSTISGSYHSKISIGLIELSRLTDNKLYKRVSDSICKYAMSIQKPNGQFLTNPGSNLTYLHPHLYSCEGLIYSGLSQSNDTHYIAGLKGVLWAMDQIQSSTKGGVCSNTGKDSIEQSDCTAQLLRLLILCRSHLQKYVDNSELDNVINRLHLRLLEFNISFGEDRGGMRYHLNLDSACSWCTMFSMQALQLWKTRNSEGLNWIQYFV